MTAPETIDAYIRAAPEAVQPILARVRASIREVLPEAAKERMSYRMPAFELDEIVIYFAAFKAHLGIFPPIPADGALERELAPLRGPKGNLRIPLDEPFPYDLVRRVATAALTAYEERRAVKRAKATAKRGPVRAG